MDFKNIEKQLRNQDWLNNFNNNLTHDLIKQTGQILPRGRKIISLTYANQLKLNGAPGTMWWILILTDQDIMLLEYPLDKRIERATRALKVLTFDEIKMVSGKRSKNNERVAKINIVTDNQAWIFETYDLDSGLHFVDKTEHAIIDNVNQLANVLKTKEFNDLEIIQGQKRKKDLKHHPYFNYFFNYPSLLKSSPALQFIFLTNLFIWWVLAITSSALIDQHHWSASTQMGLGFPMIIFSFVALAFIGLDFSNTISQVKFGAKTRHLVLTALGLAYLLVVSILVSVNVPSLPIFLAIGMVLAFFWLGDWTFLLVAGAHEAKINATTNLVHDLTLNQDQF